MFPDSNYQEGLVKLEPGDVVIAFTDGMIEVANRSGQEWGIEGLLKAASIAAQYSENAEDLVKRILNSMDEFSNGQQTDDATLAVVRVS
jgi:phosphoserine phosphatase RsbU/P